MAVLLQRETRLEAWLAATKHLLAHGTELNLILSIGSPGSDVEQGREVSRRIDDFYVAENAYPLHTVAETVFPGWEYQRRGLRGVFELYPDTEYPLIKTRWGTYAHRLLRRRTASNEVVNPLRTLIEKMKREASRRGGFKAVYELGVAEGEYDMPLYNTVDDRRLTRGGPCLSHLSFKLYQEAVSLTAIYRSHDYRYKVPGNLLGLARLQACVGKEVGVSVGSLVVHSTYAYIEAGKGKKRLQELVATIDDLLKGGSKS
jgi:hypothetical protein